MRHRAWLFLAAAQVAIAPARAEPAPANAAEAPPGYCFGDQPLAVAELAARTYADALLAIRDGRTVFEDYRDQSATSDGFISFWMAKPIVLLLISYFSTAEPRQATPETLACFKAVTSRWTANRQRPVRCHRS